MKENNIIFYGCDITSLLTIKLLEKLKPKIKIFLIPTREKVTLEWEKVNFITGTKDKPPWINIKKFIQNSNLTITLLNDKQIKELDTTNKILKTSETEIQFEMLIVEPPLITVKNFSHNSSIPIFSAYKAEDLLELKKELLKRNSLASNTVRCVIVGGNRSGFEISLAISKLLQKTKLIASIHLIEAKPLILPDYRVFYRKAIKILGKNKITSLSHNTLTHIKDNKVILSSDRQIATDLVINATGQVVDTQCLKLLSIKEPSIQDNFLLSTLKNVFVIGKGANINNQNKKRHILLSEAKYLARSINKIVNREHLAIETHYRSYKIGTFLATSEEKQAFVTKKWYLHSKLVKIIRKCFYKKLNDILS